MLQHTHTTHTHTHTYMHAPTHVCRHEHMHVCTCVSTHTHTHTPTHTHPHTPSLSLSFFHKSSIPKVQTWLWNSQVFEVNGIFWCHSVYPVKQWSSFCLLFTNWITFYYQLMSVVLLKWTHWYRSMLQVYFSIKTGMIPLESIVIFTARADLILWQMWVTVISRFIVFSVVPPSKGRKEKCILLSWNWGEITEF